MFFHGSIKKSFLQFKLCHEGSNQIAYSFFQLVPDRASADKGSLSIVACGQGRAGA